VTATPSQVFISQTPQLLNNAVMGLNGHFIGPIAAELLCELHRRIRSDNLEALDRVSALSGPSSGEFNHDNIMADNYLISRHSAFS
jgi:hypothetical protein